MLRFVLFLFSVCLSAVWGNDVSESRGPKIGVCVVGEDPKYVMHCVESAYDRFTPKEQIHYFIFIPTQYIPNMIYEDEQVTMIPTESAFTVDWFLPLYTPVVLSSYEKLFTEYDALVVLDSQCLFIKDIDVGMFTRSVVVSEPENCDMPYSQLFWGGPKDYVLDVCHAMTLEIQDFLLRRRLLSPFFASKLYDGYWDKHPPESVLESTFLINDRREYRIWKRNPSKRPDVHVICQGVL